MKGRRRLVIDASVAQAAGESEATDTKARNCRDFLQAVLTICHRAVFPPLLTAEWKSHASRFARRWQVAMERKHKIDWIDVVSDAELHEAIAEVAASAKDQAEMVKDAFLLETALATTERMVVSLDDTAKELFRILAVKLPRFAKVVWINPGSEDDRALSWLQSGAKPEPARRLGRRPKRKG
jgi:predicted nucleic acid-binding protein